MDVAGVNGTPLPPANVENLRRQRSRGQLSTTDPCHNSYGMPQPRLHSIDLLRGLVMILMALDHVRDFFFTHTIDPTNLSQTTPGLFFTRWITHFCAPTFLLLAGIGAALSKIRGKPIGDLARFLITRGFWLIFLEWAVVRTLGWAWNFDFTYLPCWVIWTLGWAMIVLGLLVRFPTWVIVVFGLTLIFGHHLTDHIKSTQFGSWSWIWTFLHDPRDVTFFGIVLSAGYPLIPWIGVMAVGYGLGMSYRWEAPHRRKLLMMLGTFCCVAFLFLRSGNAFGENDHWQPQATMLKTVMSFINCTKQPPSLCYLLMTLGPALFLLAVFELEMGPWIRPIVTFGKVPMFYYLFHLPLIHALCVLAAWWQLGAFPHWLFTNPPLADMPKEFGFPLSVTYGVWLLVLAILYPLCAWYAGVKQRNKSVLLSYV